MPIFAMAWSMYHCIGFVALRAGVLLTLQRDASWSRRRYLIASLVLAALYLASMGIGWASIDWCKPYAECRRGWSMYGYAVLLVGLLAVVTPLRFRKPIAPPTARTDTRSSAP